MALTCDIDRALPLTGTKKVYVTARVTFDSSLAAGGESLTAAMLGLSSIDILLVSLDAAALPGYSVQYDYTAATLEGFESGTADAAFNEANADDWSTMIARVVAIGDVATS